MNLVVVINVLLCAIILILGIVTYAKKKEANVLLISVAFGLFGLSHLMQLVGMSASFESALLVVRVLAYLLVAIALGRIALK